jgi:hypothetical protein
MLRDPNAFGDLSRRHSQNTHSIILDHGNALIYQRNFFCLRSKPRPRIRQIVSLLISKGNLRDSDFARLRPTTIAIDWSIFEKLKGERRCHPGGEQYRQRLYHRSTRLEIALNRVHTPGQGAARGH